MLKSIHLSMLLMAALLFVACNKSSTETPVDKDDPKGLGAKLIGNWKLSAQVSEIPYDWDGNGTDETDVFSIYSSCGKDQGFVFNVDGTGSRKIPCQAAWLTTWKVFSNSDSIRLMKSINNGQTYSNGGAFSLVEVAGSRLVVQYKLSMNGGTPLQVTDTFLKQ
jgi:hypothetical protein